MGFLDKWTKKTEKEQLKATEKKAVVKATPKKNTIKEGAVKKDGESKEESKKEVTAKVSKKVNNVGAAYRILLQPVISEKAAVAESQGVYTFMVNKRSTKIDIKNAIKQVYNVLPLKVRVINKEGKGVRFGRNSGRKSDWKKAIITLAKGQTISIHEGV